MRNSEKIHAYILDNIENFPKSIVRRTSGKFDISRQAINRHIQILMAKDLITASGHTKNKVYGLKPITEFNIPLPIKPELDEDRVWQLYIADKLADVKPNVLSVCHYGFTEMYNNVLDHSEGGKAIIGISHFPTRIELRVDDDGIGIFNKLTKELSLSDPREAILELTKGKLTTDPDRHTGEGIFFTSRMFDSFSILSGNLFFSHTLGSDDWLLEDKESTSGTSITMQIRINTRRRIKDIFDKYAGKEYDQGFRRTHVPVLLAAYGREDLVSRSQAKRLLARFNRFDEVFLDFSGVKFIGRAFADEIFRVFRNNNPDIELVWVRQNKDVERMIKRVISESKKAD